MKRLSLLAMALLFSLLSFAQTDRASAEFLFAPGSMVLDSAIDGNERQLAVLDSLARQFSQVPESDRYLRIYSYTSPESAETGDGLLSHKRAEALHKEFNRRLGGHDAHAVYTSVNYGWANVLWMVRQDAEVPHRDQVIEVLDHAVKNYLKRPAVIANLRAIDNGESYAYITDHIFPKMRKVVVETRYVHQTLPPTPAVTTPAVTTPEPVEVEKPQPEVVAEPEIAEEQKPEVAEPAPVEVETPQQEVVEEPTPDIVPPVVPEVPEEPEPTPAEEPKPEVVEPTPVEVETPQPEVAEEPAPEVIAPEPEVVAEPEMGEKPVLADSVAAGKPLQEDSLKISELQPVDTIVQRPQLVVPDTVYQMPYQKKSFASHFAVKTNLLYDLALVPNIAVEWSFADHWSVSADWMYAWWSRDAKHDYWRTYGGGVELRYWLGHSSGERMRGHHVGVYGGILTYDVEWGQRGYMGEKWSYMAGLSYGYALPVSKRLNLDFEIGLGYFGGEYYEYEPEGGRYYWQQTKNRRWFGPTRAEVSLVWLLGGRSGK